MVTSISYLFDPVLLGDDARKLLPDNYVIRPLAQDDFSKGYTDLLAVLTTVGDVSEAMFNDTFQSMLSSRNYYIVVVEDLAARRIVASASIICEYKFIHNCGKVAHIEDVVVAKDQQGKKLGSIIVNQLLDLAKALGCYKTILDCSPENAPFYNKLGLVEKGLQMARYYEDGSAALSPIPTSNSNNNKL